MVRFKKQLEEITKTEKYAMEFTIAIAISMSLDRDTEDKIGYLEANGEIRMSKPRDEKSYAETVDRAVAVT